jgi:hypothetical protein
MATVLKEKTAAALCAAGFISQPTCIAYLEDGRVCGLPAMHLDTQRGGFVCDDHRPAQEELL